MITVTPPARTGGAMITVALAGLGLWLVLHAGLRATGLYGPAEARPLILLSFFMLWPAPFFLLGREGRLAIGLFQAPGLMRAGLSAWAGAAFAAGAFALCWALFGDQASNPFVSIRDSYFSGAALPPLGQAGLFALFTIPALIFSPVGEEIFCRGVIWRRISLLAGPAAGVAASAAIFAGLHLLHHGLVLDAGAIGFRWGSGAIWFALMAAVSLLFSALRSWSGTIWAAVIAHAGFNLAMNTAIFTVLGAP
jgi:hypothetical protein